jgi:catechol 2,3-dioxygenase-like lactoylglutathione lyase family enzyme
MFKDSKAYSGFAVDDLEAAKRFYGETLGVEVDEEGPGLNLKLAGDRPTFIYPKSDHTPAEYTILNFPVDDIDAAVDALVERGIEMKRFEGFDQDEKGVMRAHGPNIAWFTDPAGNVLSVIEDS